MIAKDQASRQVRLPARKKVVANAAINGDTSVADPVCYRSTRKCLDVRLRLNMSCFGLLLQHAPLSFHLSLANLNDLVTKCSSDLFKRLMSRLPMYRVNT